MISEKTLHTLEFDKILTQLREHASFSASQDAVETLRPLTQADGARARLAQTSEARHVLEVHPSTHVGGAHDVRPAVRRAEVGAVLTTVELLEIGSTLSAAIRVRSAILHTEGEIPWLRGRAGQIAENRALVDAVDQTLSERGEILDSASSELRRVRNEIRSAQGRLMDRLNSMVTSGENRPSLQEPIVTMRNGRYVIPVRQEARGKIPGVVHDQSSSGQTLFVEPIGVMEMNNKLKELELAEQREIERILRHLSSLVADAAPALRSTVEALRDIDVAFAKAKYASALRANPPTVNDEGRVLLVNARHPLLRGDVVPITVPLGDEFRLLVITGPNTGGKTVALKTTGLLTLMAQAGMHIPAAPESVVSVFPKIFADIGDEQSIEQSLSTFSSHMRTIIQMLPEIDERCLVLLDELGAGTDPAEGAALARSILTALLDSGSRGVVTTHYSELKMFAHEQSGAENASVEFDVETLSPTYRLSVGMPGRSQALAIAKRLGMPERILALARQSVSTGAARVEHMLTQIQTERTEIGRLYQRAREMHLDAGKLRDRIQSELDGIQHERARILASVRDEAAEVIRNLRVNLREIETDARSTASRREQHDVRSRVEEAQEVAADRLGPLSVPVTGGASALVLQPLRPGASVLVASIGQQGTVLSVHGGEAEVQIGQFKMRLPVEDLQVTSKQERQVEHAVEYHATRAAPPMELDVRGWRVDDVLREIDQYLHDNYLHGQGTVRIIHGKGTGALRKAIREQLGEHPLVKSHQAEEARQGGEGATVVKLAL
ncbi:MAG: endonuclease MutS2 [Chloroflexota bacterium]